MFQISNDQNSTSQIAKPNCYELKPLELGKRTNSCIRVNTRELNRNPFTKWSTLYTTIHGLCSLLCTLP